MTLDPDNTAGIPGEALSWVDSVCLRFERQWQNGPRPSPQNFLENARPELRPLLLAELLLLDIDYRYRIGEQPCAENYKAMFPTDQAAVDTAFASQLVSSALIAPSQRGSEGTTVRQAMKYEPPARLGRFQIIRKLGAGGSGSVYLAVDDDLLRHVAIKFPHECQSSANEEVNFLLEEARMVATLHHPAIVPVFDIGRLDANSGGFYVVSQFMDGGDLGQYISKNRLSVQETVRIVIRLAEALQYAHELGLVHRDMKPSNVLLDSNGDVYVADFGLASRNVPWKIHSEFSGTPAYMSPEQVSGKTEQVDHRTDVYGLGVILYELLTGVRPFSASNIKSLLELVDVHDIRPPRNIRGEIPAGLEFICLKALAKRPEDRYPSALDLAEALRSWQSGSDPENANQRQNAVNRLVVIVALVLATVVAVVMWPLLYSRLARNSGGIESLAVLPFKQTNESGDGQILGLGMADSLIGRLGNLRRLVVRPVRDVTEFPEQKLDPVSWGRKLNVDAVLEGTIERSGETIRVSVDLLRVNDESLVWNDSFEVNQTDSHRIPVVLSDRLAKVLNLKPSINEQARLLLSHTENALAHEAWLKGRYYWNQRSELGGVDLAITYYKQAIELDPLFALAYAGLAESYVMMNLYSYRQYDDAFLIGKAAAEQALRLNPDLSEAHATLAYAKFFFDFDWEGAEKAFQTALELNPNYAPAHQWYAEFLYFTGRFSEAQKEIDRAGELDPLSPVIRSIRGSPFMLQGDYESAIREYREALDFHPDSVVALYGLGICFESLGKFDDALKVYQRMHAPPDAVSPAGLAGQAWVYAKTGREAESRAILQTMVCSSDGIRFSPYLTALVYAGLGESDQAVKCLKLAWEEHDERLVWVRLDPKLKSLRADPGFKEFLNSIGIRTPTL